MRAHIYADRRRTMIHSARPRTMFTRSQQMPSYVLTWGLSLKAVMSIHTLPPFPPLEEHWRPLLAWGGHLGECRGGRCHRCPPALPLPTSSVVIKLCAGPWRHHIPVPHTQAHKCVREHTQAHMCVREHTQAHM